MPQNALFLRTRDLLISPKTTQRHFLFTLHPHSTVIFATATVLAFVLLRNSNFNFHCYTQREATPTQKSAGKYAATSRDFFRERLRSAFTLANSASLNHPIQVHARRLLPSAVPWISEDRLLPVTANTTATIEPIEPWGVSLGNELIHFRFLKSLLPVGEKPARFLCKTHFC